MTHSLHACLLAPHFAAQVAQDQLSLGSNQPFIIANGMTDRATVVDASSSASARGIYPGMLVWVARRRCRSLRVVPHDPVAVGQACERITAVLAQHSDMIEQATSGQWEFPLRGLGSGFSQATDIAAQLHEDVRRRTSYRCQLGLAMHPLIAEIAAHAAHKQSNPCLVVLPDAAVAFLAPLPVGMLPGVGLKTERTLQRLGVATIGQLADVPPGVLTQLFGSRGAQLARAARGLPPQDTVAPETIRYKWQSLDEPQLDPQLLHAEVYTLAEQIGRHLRTLATAAGACSVEVTWSDGVRRREAVHWPQRCDLDRDLAIGTRKALDTLLRERRIAVTSMSVTASNLGPIQRGLLNTEDERGRQLQQAVDGIKERYGARAILPAAVWSMLTRTQARA